MEFLLVVGLIIVAVLLFDARSRLKALETRLAERDATGQWAGPPASRPVPALARIVPDPVVSTTVAVAPVVVDTLPVDPVSVDRITDAPSIALPDPVAPKPKRGWSFEELFGGKLLIWAGGVTLAVAGVLLVKYSIDLGLLSPAVRVVIGLLFGTALIGGAEAALRQQARVDDPRVHQALSGAGIASLYAAILAAANLYGLIGGGVAFAGLAVVTALAMGLSLRFGAPSAVLGLVGGLAAPALVQAGPPNVPLLCAYLALAIGSLTALSRRQRWLWLGVAAMIGGAGWSGILILTGALDVAATLSLGMLVLLLGLALPLLAVGGEDATDAAGQWTGRLLRGGGALVAALQIAAIVATGGFALLQWGLYLLLSAAVVWLADRERTLRFLPAIGLAVGLALASFWPTPPMDRFALIIGALGLIYGVGALRNLWRGDGSLLEAGQIAGGAVVVWLVARLQFYDYDNRSPSFALLALALALVPVGAAVLGWRSAPRAEDSRFTLLAFGTGVLVALAAYAGLAGNLFAIAMALALLAGAEGARRGLGRAMRPTLALHALLTLIGGFDPLLQWAVYAQSALYGSPLLASDLPLSLDALRELGLPALLAGLALWRAGAIVPPLAARIVQGVIGIVAAIALHCVYRQQVFGLSTPDAVTRLGLADRIVWEALWLGGAILLWRFTAARRIALAIVAAVLLHSFWFTLVTLNPLWARVAVGPWPVANLLLPAFAVPFAALWMIERLHPAAPRRLIDGGRMILVILLAYASLRQLFVGAILVDAPVSEAENIGWSVLAIGLAIGFLIWGIRRASHDWRIASLLLMLAAVAKVFLFDASGLTGLLRIASFLALGFSLIGIGWLYSRYLKRQDA